MQEAFDLQSHPKDFFVESAQNVGGTLIYSLKRRPFFSSKFKKKESAPLWAKNSQGKALQVMITKPSGSKSKYFASLCSADSNFTPPPPNFASVVTGVFEILHSDEIVPLFWEIVLPACRRKRRRKKRFPLISRGSNSIISHTVSQYTQPTTLYRSCPFSTATANNGHFYGTWSLAKSSAKCAVLKEAEKCINTNNGQNKKVLGHATTKPPQNLYTTISVNKTKLSVTKHDQTLTWARIYTSRSTANTKCCSVEWLLTLEANVA